MNVSSEGSDDRAATATATTTALPAAGSSDSFSDVGQRRGSDGNEVITHVPLTFLGQKLKYYVCSFSAVLLFPLCCLAHSHSQTHLYLWFASQYFMRPTPSSPLSTLSPRPLAFVALSAAFRQIKIASGRGKQKCFPFV